MDEFDFFIDEDEFEVFVDHEAGFDDCDPGMLAWSEAQLAHWDQGGRPPFQLSYDD